MAEPKSQQPACAIVLHGSPSIVTDQVIHEITEYLNEYDEEADGLWLSATRELIYKAAKDSSNRRLLGMPDLEPTQDADSAAERLKTLKALSNKGHMVCRAPDDTLDELAPGRAFHAGIGNHTTIEAPCHIIANPDLISKASIPHLIGDTFLEWLLSDQRNQQGIQSIR